MSPRSLQRDSSCPKGGAFYSCNNGFVGCCLVEACNPGGCPTDKDTTPNSSSTQGASTTTTQIISVVTVAPTLSTSTTSSASLLSTTTSDFTATSQPANSTSPSSAPATEHRHNTSSATSAAAIVGGVLGGVIIIAIIVGLLFYIRRRKRTKVYKAAIYPSPNVGSDMSPQLPDYQEPKVSRFAGLMGTKQKFAHHIHSREIVPAAEMGEAPPRHIVYAELPASNDSIRNI